VTTPEQLGRRPSTGASREPYLVLLADDSDDDVFFIKRALEDFPHLRIVWRASDGEQAAAYLSGSGEFRDREKYPWPDIVVLDLKMPNRNGFEVLECMRGKYPRPKLGVFTCSDDPREEKLAYELGADLFQTKTTDAEKLHRFFHWLTNLALEHRRLEISKSAAP
jgi:CheY-like chemotaxis protein